MQHPRYSHYGNYPNDIALLELAQEVYGGRVAARPACLQGQGEKTYEERPDSYYNYDSKGCWLTGWGATLGELSQVLMVAVASVVVEAVVVFLW